MKFSIGDKVKVVDVSRTYNTYKNFCPTVLPGKADMWVHGRFPNTGDIYTVLIGHVHTTMPENGTLYIIENSVKTQVFVIGEGGLELVESVLPRICYVLGGEDTPLEIGEEFELDGISGYIYRINSEGRREYSSTDGDLVWLSAHSESDLANAINHPEKIIRKPRLTFTEDEKAFMRLLGKGWLARGKDGNLFWYEEKPLKYNNIYDSQWSFEALPKCLLSQITFENSPVNLEDYI